jgi:hypothetical protein
LCFYRAKHNIKYYILFFSLISTILNPEIFRAISILIDHPEERHLNLLLQTAMRYFHG